MRQGTSIADSNAKTGQGIASTAGKNATSLYNTLMPEYAQEASGNDGFSSGDMSSMNTAAQQSVGGSVAGAVGQGDLSSARTRNAGGFTSALDDSVRSGQQTLSQDALGVQDQNAMLKQANKQAGIAGEAGLYGQQEGQQLGALGMSNSAVNAATGAGASGWYQNMISGINAGANVIHGK